MKRGLISLIFKQTETKIAVRYNFHSKKGYYQREKINKLMRATWEQETIHEFQNFFFCNYQRNQNCNTSCLHIFSPCTRSLCSETCLLSWSPSMTPTSTVQFSSVTQSYLTLCDPMNRSMPGLPVHHQFPEFTPTHVHRVSDAIQPSHPLLSPISSCPQSLPASESFPMSQLFHEVAKVLEFQL